MKRINLRRALLVDLAVAAVLVGIILIIGPGLAIVGLLALLVLLAGGASLVIDLRRQARRGPRPDLRGPR